MGWDYEEARDAYWNDPETAEKELRDFENSELTSTPEPTTFHHRCSNEPRTSREGNVMATRPTRRSAPTSRNKAAAPPAPARRTKSAPAKAAPVKRTKDVTEYAHKPATPYHKAFAKWIVEEVGYDPNSASSLRAAFLKGVSIATAARPSFNESDFIEEWREKSGETKRGPKPKEEAPAPASRRRKPAPAPVEEEDEDDDFDDDEDVADEDDDFEDDADSDEDDDEDSDDDFEDDEDDEEEEEPAPAPKTRARRAAPTSKPAARSGTARKSPAGKAAPAKRAAKAATAADDDFLF